MEGVAAKKNEQRPDAVASSRATRQNLFWNIHLKRTHTMAPPALGTTSRSGTRLQLLSSGRARRALRGGGGVVGEDWGKEKQASLRNRTTIG